MDWRRRTLEWSSRRHRRPGRRRISFLRSENAHSRDFEVCTTSKVFQQDKGFSRSLCPQQTPLLFRQRRLMQYRAEATSLGGFVQQIACCYLRHGYWFYVTGCIPSHKEAEVVDRKLIEKYGIGVSESTRARRKQLGQANLQYIRHQRTFVILATHGDHDFFRVEANTVRDIRHVPLKYSGYAISYRRGARTRDGRPDGRWHAHVEIERRRYLELKAQLMELAVHRQVEHLALQFYKIPYEPYAPIRRQLLNMLRAVNLIRRRAGYQAVPVEVLPLRRRIVRPFELPPARTAE